MRHRFALLLASLLLPSCGKCSGKDQSAAVAESASGVAFPAEVDWNDEPAVLARSQNAPSSIGRTEADVVWLDRPRSGVGQVVWVGKKDGNAVVLAADRAGISHLWVTDDWAYWTDREGVHGRIPHGDGTFLGAVDADRGTARLVATAGTFVYVTLEHMSKTGGLYRFPKSGGPDEAVALGFSHATGLATGKDAIYLCTGASGETLVRVPTDGSAATLLLRGMQGCTGLVQSGTSLYWIEESPPRICAMNMTGGAVTSLAVDGVKPTGLAVDDKSIYWTANQDGRVMRMPRSGGQVHVMATALRSPQAITVDGANLYWTDLREGTVLRLPKDLAPVLELAPPAASPPRESVEEPVPEFDTAISVPPGYQLSSIDVAEERYETGDKSSSLTVRRGQLTTTRTLESLWDEASQETDDRSIIFKRRSGNWFAVSGYTDNGHTIYYLRISQRGPRWAGFEMRYPTSNGSQVEPVLDQVSRSFAIK